MLTISGEQALANRKRNPARNWNNAGASAEVSPDPHDASRRIYDGFADLRVRYDGPRPDLADPVFAMGSCFAREIEAALIGMGGHVVSVDGRLDRPEFRDADGKVRSTFFHRYTPHAMLQEFQRAFGEGRPWPQGALLLPQKKAGRFADLNFAGVAGADASLEAVLVRREVAAELVREAARARVVILTLGLIESWLHRPTGLYVNAPTPMLLTRHTGELELQLMDVGAVVACLEGIHDLLRRRHVDGRFQMVVTVSPVPLSATFTDQDIVVANAESKAVLRAAAAAFTAGREDVHYFPSYEIATYSSPALTWRPDRVHVTGKLTRHIVRTFMRAYYAR